MRQIAPMIIEEHLKSIEDVRKTKKVIIRHTARAIILSRNKESILMAYSKEFNDYTFVGGGIKKGESKMDALKREVLEEMGAIIVRVFGAFGYIDELREGIQKNDDSEYVFHQRSFFFFVKTKKVTEQQLEEREKAHGIELRWINIDEAIRHNRSALGNDKHQIRGLKTVLLREISVLEAIKVWIEDFRSSRNI